MNDVFKALRNGVLACAIALYAVAALQVYALNNAFRHQALADAFFLHAGSTRVPMDRLAIARAIPDAERACYLAAVSKTDGGRAVTLSTLEARAAESKAVMDVSTAEFDADMQPFGWSLWILMTSPFLLALLGAVLVLIQRRKIGSSAIHARAT